MRIVLDTGVFYRPAALEELRSPSRRVIVPAVALAERKRQLARDRRAIEPFLRGVEEAGFDVEPFGIDEALRMPDLDDKTWNKRARDALICAHVQEQDVLWTTNPRDFLAMGLAPEQMRAV